MIFDRKFRARHRFILGESGVHYAASLIDPHVQGRGLSTEQTLKGELEKEWNSFEIPSWNAFKTKKAFLKFKDGLWIVSKMFIYFEKIYCSTPFMFPYRRTLLARLFW